MSLKYFRSKNGRSPSIGMQYLNNQNMSLLVSIILSMKEYTILHVTYLWVVSPRPSCAQNPAQSLALFHRHSQIHGNHERHNRDGLKMWAHRRCCGYHAVSEEWYEFQPTCYGTIADLCRGFELNLVERWGYRSPLISTMTYFLTRACFNPINLWTVCCVAYSLQDSCLSCVCSSDNQHSKSKPSEAIRRFCRGHGQEKELRSVWNLWMINQRHF